MHVPMYENVVSRNHTVVLTVWWEIFEGLWKLFWSFKNKTKGASLIEIIKIILIQLVNTFGRCVAQYWYVLLAYILTAIRSWNSHVPEKSIHIYLMLFYIQKTYWCLCIMPIIPGCHVTTSHTSFSCFDSSSDVHMNIWSSHFLHITHYRCHNINFKSQSCIQLATNIC